MPSNRNCTASAASSTPTTRRHHGEAGEAEQPLDRDGDQHRQHSRARGSPAAPRRPPRHSRLKPPVPVVSRITALMAPGPAISGVASGNTEISSRLLRFVLFLGRRAGAARMAGEHHVDRDQQQQDAAGGAQRRQGDAEQAQHRFAEDGEEQQDAAGDEDAAQRHRRRSAWVSSASAPQRRAADRPARWWRRRWSARGERSMAWATWRIADGERRPLSACALLPTVANGACLSSDSRTEVDWPKPDR